MLRLNPRERPSADEILRSPELASKLSLDEDPTTMFAQQKQREKAILELISTIKVRCADQLQLQTDTSSRNLNFERASFLGSSTAE